MRSIKLLLMGRQRPLQFSYDCGGFDFSGVLTLSRAGNFSMARWNPARTSPLGSKELSKRAAILARGLSHPQAPHACLSVGRYAPLVQSRLRRMQVLQGTQLAPCFSTFAPRGKLRAKTTTWGLTTSPCSHVLRGFVRVPRPTSPWGGVPPIPPKGALRVIVRLRASALKFETFKPPLLQRLRSSHRANHQRYGANARYWEHVVELRSSAHHLVDCLIAHRFTSH